MVVTEGPGAAPFERALTGAEALAASAALMPAATIVAAYLLDKAGLTLHPFVLLGVALGSGAATLLAIRRRIDWRPAEIVVLAAIVLGAFGWLLWIARPSFLPLGSGSDLTHHLLLIQYIEQHWRLVHDPGAERFLGEMMSYTPGSQLLAALAGAWTGVGGVHALHAVVSATVALKLGFVFLVALRVLNSIYPEDGSGVRSARLPFAVLAVVLAFTSQVYLLRSFVENSFVAQVVSELFGVVMWWSLTVWDMKTGRFPVVCFGLAGAAAFLTWPLWIGPPIVVAVILALLDSRRPFAERLTQLTVAGAPIAIVGGLYIAGRAGWFGMAGVSGGAPMLLVANYGAWFVALSSVGMLLTASRREGRSTALMAVAIGTQSAALYFVARRNGADAPYMALKMFYLLLYPQAVAAALMVAVFWRAIVSVLVGAAKVLNVRRFERAWLVEIVLASLLVARIGVAVAKPLAGAPRSLTLLRHPAVSAPLEQAGQWARANVPPSCVEYLVDNDETAYWLHLAVLGNPRIDARSVDVTTYQPGPAMIRWLTPGGLPYAIADLNTIPRGVRDKLDVVAGFGTAVVAKRRGSSSCPAQR